MHPEHGFRPFPIYLVGKLYKTNSHGEQFALQEDGTFLHCDNSGEPLPDAKPYVLASREVKTDGLFCIAYKPMDIPPYTPAPPLPNPIFTVHARYPTRSQEDHCLGVYASLDVVFDEIRRFLGDRPYRIYDEEGLAIEGTDDVGLKVMFDVIVKVPLTMRRRLLRRDPDNPGQYIPFD